MPVEGIEPERKEDAYLLKIGIAYEEDKWILLVEPCFQARNNLSSLSSR